MININKTKGIWETYSLIRKLSSTNSSDISKELLDRTIYNSETLPPLGKEYWWFTFFDQNGNKERPMQMMLMMFRKHGKGMLFNNKEMVLKELEKNKFQAVTAGWIYDGKELRDLGDTNAITEIRKEKIVSEISGQKITFSGGFPDYKLKVGKIIDLDIRRTDYPENKCAHGVFIPPFGMGWVDAFLEAEGFVLGKKFKGSAHLQKVVGVTTYGPFHWGRILFRNGSSTSFFCLKTGKDSKRFFYNCLNFYDHDIKRIIRFENPKLTISKKGRKKPIWIVEGLDKDKEYRLVLESYTKKQFTIKGSGKQVYIEYAIIPKEFVLKSGNETITLNDLGSGVGTFEDAYW